VTIGANGEATVDRRLRSVVHRRRRCGVLRVLASTAATTGNGRYDGERNEQAASGQYGYEPAQWVHLLRDRTNRTKGDEPFSRANHASSQAGNDGVVVLDGECDAARQQKM